MACHGDGSLIRERLKAAYKDADEGGDEITAATLRLVFAALNEHDYCARDVGDKEGLDDQAIVNLLREMVTQRRADIGRCEVHARLDMAEKEAAEIEILEQFLPAQMSQDEIDRAVDEAIRDLGATKLKDTGRVIANLKERYNGHMDFSTAKRFVCQRLH